MPETAERTLFIRQNGASVQGPFPLSRIQGWAQAGKVRREMEFSVDGDNWIPGDMISGVFETATTPTPSKGSTRRRRSRARHTDGLRRAHQRVEGLDTRTLLHAIMGVCVLGLVASAFTFWTVSASNGFRSESKEFLIWPNVFGAIGTALFGLVLLACAFLYRDWKPEFAKIIGKSGFAATCLQVLAFVLLAGVVKVGWTGDMGKVTEAMAEVDDDIEHARDRFDEAKDRGGPPGIIDAAREAFEDTLKMLEPRLPKFSFGVGFYGLVICSLGLGYISRVMVRR